jgi:hypothetical protein
MLDIETFMNVPIGHTINIDLSTKSIHRDNQEEIFRRIQNPQISCSPCQKDSARKSLERPTRRKHSRILSLFALKIKTFIIFEQDLQLIEAALWSEGFIFSFNSIAFSTIENQLDAWRARVTVALVQSHRRKVDVLVSGRHGLTSVRFHL